MKRDDVSGILKSTAITQVDFVPETRDIAAAPVAESRSAEEENCENDASARRQSFRFKMADVPAIDELFAVPGRFSRIPLPSAPPPPGGGDRPDDPPYST